MANTYRAYAHRTNPLTATFCLEHSLSPREIQVIFLAIDGEPNKIIADCLGCATSTVMSYWQRIFMKTQCRTRCEVLGRIIRSQASNK